MSKPLNGECLCGAVTFEITPPFRDVLICHCNQCAKWTGHQVAATAVGSNQIQLRTGQEALTWYRSSSHAERGFCSSCGSSLFWKPASGDRVSVMAGTIDDPDGVLSVGAHWYVAEQRPYLASADDAPQYAAACSESAIAPGTTTDADCG